LPMIYIWLQQQRAAFHPIP